MVDGYVDMLVRLLLLGLVVVAVALLGFVFLFAYMQRGHDEGREFEVKADPESAAKK
jgi:hypothetical protein